MNSTLKALFAFALLALLTANGAHGFLKDLKNLRDNPFINRILRRFTRNDQTENVEPLEGATSGSRTELKGWFKIRVIGTGRACYVKEYRSEYSDFEQFGEYATSEAFIKFFGEPECEPGDVGFAWGKVKASVVAAAYEKGEECLTTVLSSVIIDPFRQFSKGDVRVRISGNAEGEALALCEESEEN